MRTFSISVDIQAPPPRVWAAMADVERWPEWTASVHSVERLDPGPLAVGSRARIRQPRLPPALWEVVAVDEGRSFTWVSRGPGVRVTARHEVEPAAGGSRATLSLRFDGPFGGLLARVTSGINRRYLGMESSGLKRRSEGPS
jgi:uncharacterized protein YndB with AHSA1/START domain